MTTQTWIQALDQTGSLDAAVDFSIYEHRTERDVIDIQRVNFEDADPIRDFTSYPGKRNFEGKFWFATTGRHVPFESFWERSFLAMIDRFGGVSAVASQPMTIRWRQTSRSHTPDYFVRHDDGSATLVDVRPAELIAPEDEAKFEATRRIAAAMNWRYVVFDDLAGATQVNLRFLLRYRDPRWLEGVEIGRLGLPRRTPLAALARHLDDVAPSGIAAVYATIWRGLVLADLSRPLAMTTVLTVQGEQ